MAGKAVALTKRRRGQGDSSMRLLKLTCCALLATSLSFGQTGGTNTNSNVTDEIQKLRDAVAEQQKQIAQQQQEIEKLRQQMGSKQDVSANSGQVSPRVIDASLHNTTAANPAAQPASDAPIQEDQPKESPLSFRIGGAQFTPGGFVDFENIFRSTNTGNVAATNFNAIPFNNTVQGHLTEFRSTAQFSRLSLKVTDKFGENDVTGYAEMDFNGNDPANVFVTSNSHTNRVRLYWLDLKRGKWEFTGGQAWSWLTPNRNGIGPLTSDLFVTQNEDANITVGQVYTRASQFRVAYHPNDNWALGIAIENPQQFVGAGEVVFPFALNAALGVQFDAANNNGAPNAHPDLIPKITFDANPGGHHFHFEAVGLLTTKKVFNPIVNQTNSATGGAGSFNASIALHKNFSLFANTFFSDGGGRYANGLAPDAVVRPDGTVSLVHSSSGTLGFELQATKNTLFAGTYGGVYAQRNFFLDTTNPLPGRFEGFGAPNSPNSANRSLQEGSLNWIQTFWKHPQYGALQLVTQYSYVTRSPWFVALGAPKNAHLSMGYMSIKYVLP
jgi:cell division protein FtsB